MTGRLITDKALCLTVGKCSLGFAIQVWCLGGKMKFLHCRKWTMPFHSWAESPCSRVVPVVGSMTIDAALVLIPILFPTYFSIIMLIMYNTMLSSRNACEYVFYRCKGVDAEDRLLLVCESKASNCGTALVGLHAVSHISQEQMAHYSRVRLELRGCCGSVFL